MSQTPTDRIVAIFTDIVGTPPINGVDTLPSDVPAWDSLTHIKFVHAVENEFDCELPEEFLLVGKPLRDFAIRADEQG